MDRSIENKSEALKVEESPSVLAEDPNSAGNHGVKMEPKSEQTDRSIENKSEDLKEEGGPSGKPPPVEKEEKPHPPHSFTWTFKGQKPTKVSCNRAGTVEDSLKRNPQFEGIAKKNQELVLLRNGKAICSHFPCSLIKKECLTVKFIRAGNKTGVTAGGPDHVSSSDEFVLFHVRMMGDKGVRSILENPELKNGVDEMTVYAYKGETVEQALRRDARLKDSIIDNKCLLSDDFDVDMSNPVDELDEKTFTIKWGKNLRKSLPSNPKESQRPDTEDNQGPSEQPVNDTTDTGGHKAAEKTREPTSEEMMSYFSSQFENLLNGEITDPLHVGNKKLHMTEILRVEFGKKAQTCTEVKTMKELMRLSNSVCQVILHDGSTGTGFLLFDRFVLTNAHVVEDVYNKSLKKLKNKVIVHFSYESRFPTEREQDAVAEVEVEEVAGFEHTEDVYDWALLKLRAGVNLPNGLLNKCGDFNRSHGVRIIGHPDGGVKRIETCLSIAPEKRNQVVEKSRSKNQQNNTILITDRYFERVAKQVKRLKNVQTYRTCFYEGASGSPVFDQDCNVLAMHSGGYQFKDKKTDTIKNVIEFGYSLSDIIERIKIQLVGKKEADGTFKEFFEFCDKKEHVPMDTC